MVDFFLVCIAAMCGLYFGRWIERKQPDKTRRSYYFSLFMIGCLYLATLTTWF